MFEDHIAALKYTLLIKKEEEDANTCTRKLSYISLASNPSNLLQFLYFYPIRDKKKKLSNDTTPLIALLKN